VAVAEESFEIKAKGMDDAHVHDLLLKTVTRGKINRTKPRCLTSKDAFGLSL